MGGVVCRRDCGVCGWKDRCRDGNLRRYCRVSPILFGFFLGGGGVKGAFLGFYNTFFSLKKIFFL